MMLAVADALQRGLLGRLLDIEVHLNLLTPWHLFPFVKGAERVEIPIHSIHYLDVLRSFLGEPTGVFFQSAAPPTELPPSGPSPILRNICRLLSAQRAVRKVRGARLETSKTGALWAPKPLVIPVVTPEVKMNTQNL
jgi:hypothetical protein